LAEVRDRGFVLYIFLAGVRVVSVCVLVYARTHTNKLLGYLMCAQVCDGHLEPEESRSTRAQCTCRPYRCTQYISLYICCAAGFDDLG